MKTRKNEQLWFIEASDVRKTPRMMDYICACTKHLKDAKRQNFDGKPEIVDDSSFSYCFYCSDDDN